MRVEQVVTGARHRVAVGVFSQEPWKESAVGAGSKQARSPGIVEPLRNATPKCEVGPQTEEINLKIIPPPYPIAQPRPLTQAFREGLPRPRRANAEGWKPPRAWAGQAP